MNSPEENNGGPVIRDLRRIDPATGQVRDPGQGGSAQPGSSSRGPSKPRGKHAASKPGGASLGAPAGAAGLRGPGEPRPGKHAVSKPGRQPGAEAGATPGGATGATGPADDDVVEAEIVDDEKPGEEGGAA